MDVEAVHGIVALAEQIARHFGNLAGRRAQEQDVRLPGNGFEISEAGVFGHATQIMRGRAQRFLTAHDAHAGKIRRGFQRFNGITSDIAQTDDGSFN